MLRICWQEIWHFVYKYVAPSLIELDNCKTLSTNTGRGIVGFKMCYLIFHLERSLYKRIKCQTSKARKWEPKGGPQGGPWNPNNRGGDDPQTRGTPKVTGDTENAGGGLGLWGFPTTELCSPTPRSALLSIWEPARGPNLERGGCSVAKTGSGLYLTHPLTQSGSGGWRLNVSFFSTILKARLFMPKSNLNSLCASALVRVPRENFACFSSHSVSMQCFILCQMRALVTTEWILMCWPTSLFLANQMNHSTTTQNSLHHLRGGSSRVVMGSPSIACDPVRVKFSAGCAVVIFSMPSIHVHVGSTRLHPQR